MQGCVNIMVKLVRLLIVCAPLPTALAWVHNLWSIHCSDAIDLPSSSSSWKVLHVSFAWQVSEIERMSRLFGRLLFHWNSWEFCYAWDPTVVNRATCGVVRSVGLVTSVLWLCQISAMAQHECWHIQILPTITCKGFLNKSGEGQINQLTIRLPTFSTWRIVNVTS